MLLEQTGKKNQKKTPAITDRKYLQESLTASLLLNESGSIKINPATSKERW